VAESPAFPVALSRDGEGVRAERVGDLPSVRLLEWWRSDRPLPDGFRWQQGSRDTEPLASVEKAIDVDQTNASVVVGDRVVVKWTTGPLVGTHPGPERLQRLISKGFAAMPAVWCVLEWQTPDGHWVPVAMATDLVPGATDGWTWCLREARIALGLESGDAQPFAEQLGELTAAMHRALADDDGLVAVHGDFHVGQLLRDQTGRLLVIDFDGNPTLSAEERVAHRPAAYDVAGMLLSLENVGHVVRHYAPAISDASVLAWTEQVQADFLDSYRRTAADLLDESLLPSYVDDQIRRELAYADAHLPRWRYVPEAALTRRGLA